MTLAAAHARVTQIIRDELHLNAAQASKRAEEYIKFRQLKVEHPTAQLAPSHAVDRVWRSHILETRSYQQLQTILMPDGGFILHYSPVQLWYEEGYANTLSLLTKQHGEIDVDIWPADESQYKKLVIIVALVEDTDVAAAGLHVYCHKRHTVEQLVRSVKLVMGYTAADRIIITGMNTDDLPTSTQRVSLTALWRSSIVRVTILRRAHDENGECANVTGDNRLSYLRFQDEDSEVQVSAHDVTLVVICSHHGGSWCSMCTLMQR
jgi:hypothetical protein